MSQSLLITHIGNLYGILDQDVSRLAGSQMAEVHALENAFINICDGRIESFGDMEDAPLASGQDILDLQGDHILPCWCDSHTHIVYSRSREGEFVQRILGKSYEEIAKDGGGILNSAKHLQETSEDVLFDSALDRLHEVLQLGTGCVEIKSGYGLSVEGELKMLRVIKRLKEVSPIPIKASFLGAHAIPEIFKNKRSEYIDLLIHQVLPVIADEGLADYMDVFCDRGFFTPEETDILLKAGWKAGLRPKIHANELARSGGVQVGVANDALSVDHLECMGQEEIDALLGSDTMATLLPSTAFFLNIDYAPARDMIDAGLSIALASDYNPGSSPSGNMSLVQSLSCIKMALTPEEAFNASTINGAYAMDLSHELGSITKGKKANLMVIDSSDSLASMAYSFGSSSIKYTFIEGAIHRA